jgi:hypothetical protein
VTARTAQILGRFPQHLDAARPGKRLHAAVDALALDLDVLAAALAAVRRAHRLGDADEAADLMRLAALHGIGGPEFEVLLQRGRRTRALLAALETAADDEARATAAEALAALWSLQAVPPRLTLFADPSAPADGALAAARLAAQVRLTQRQARVNDAVRGRIGRTAAIHLRGNGTVMALLEGAANALDLELGEVMHSADRYWHAARVLDRLRLAPPPAADGSPAPDLLPAEELLGVEENPLERTTTDQTPRSHAELFTLTRRGFDRALLQVRITGEGARTVAPMFVNRDEGHGIGYDGLVAAGAELVFQEDGRVMLDGSDVTALAYAWQGACFAGDDADAGQDFVFDGEGVDARLKRARFVTMTPAAALDREASYPSDGASLPMPGIAVGVTRLAFFVREAHVAALAGTPALPLAVTPRSGQAVFDASVFAPPPLPRTPSARVALSWLEHRAFAVRLLIPPRFRLWRDASEDAEGVQTLQAVARALERHRPVGVELRVEYIDDRWTLGQGTLTSGVDDDPIESLRAGMVLWSTPAPVPS